MASRSVNKVILVGRSGKEAELSYTPGGAAVVKFCLATSRRWQDKKSPEWKEETDWHNVIWWNGEKAAQYITKGTQLYVEGRLQTRNYDNKEGKKVYVTEVVAENVILLGGNQSEQPKEQHATAAAGSSHPAKHYPPSKPISQSLEIDDSDVPF